MQGENLEGFVMEALQEHLKRQTVGVSSERGWQSVFGQAQPEEVKSVDAVVAEELGRIESDECR